MASFITPTLGALSIDSLTEGSPKFCLIRSKRRSLLSSVELKRPSFHSLSFRASSFCGSVSFRSARTPNLAPVEFLTTRCMYLTGGSNFGDGDDQQRPPDDSSESGSASPPPFVGRNDFFEKIKLYGPDDMKDLLAQVTPEAMDAMKRTILTMLGNLPPEYFQITLVTHRDNLKRLLFSAMMAGFSFRNVEYRVNLLRSLEVDHEDVSPGNGKIIIHPDELGSSEEIIHSVKLEGIQGIVRLQTSYGEKELEALAYIESLQDTVSHLKADRKRWKPRAEANALLDYLQNIDPSKLGGLKDSMSPEVVDAMEQTLVNLLGDLNIRHVEIKATTTRDYLAHLLFWAMMVGYHLRTLENKRELQARFDAPSSSPSPDMIDGSAGALFDMNENTSL
mmetsp:Transcript_3791/g.6664  ORF Transcript_3791/g.6664 Transcript_3791/m.6664 type:complete len:392 (-) Transcript_3791:367-1542(-)|eukprot:CAMPEP_0184653680 /NCGR_PEP_ID=MMETSP0308-20130426/11407_1 /TAXON_ID=38269 /ORGANISM="Gloeochaete witrockiana, Strain SAG 46.84" /LENGTH=391 /DNA_ID=CAMNT_0027089281 /DNA_START=103 /DNA_END=1278 /DNA_ORIENTATION=+